MIEVLLVDDHKIVRDGLRALIDGEEGVTVVAEAGDGREAVALARKLSPDVVVMDVAMPELGGVEATRQVTATSSRTKVLALSMHADVRFVAEMLKAGASGYILKDSAFDELVLAIVTVSEGHRYLGKGIVDDLLEDYVKQLDGNVAASAFSILTPREREVLQLLAEGFSTKEIAAELHVSGKTVETHRANLMRKTGAKGVAELTRYAIREGLVSLEK